MSKLQGFKRILAEDFDEKERPLVSKLAYSINPAFEDIQFAMNKGLSIEDNLNFNKKDITVIVDASGIPNTDVVVKSGLASSCSGIIVIKATNLTAPATSPTNTPFITFSDNSGQISINKITGLQASNQYRLRLLLIP